MEPNTERPKETSEIVTPTPNTNGTPPCDVPERLDGRAVILRYVLSEMPFELRSDHKTQVNLLINKAYLISYLEELSATIFIDTPLGMLDCGLIPDPRKTVFTIPYRDLRSFLGIFGLDKVIDKQLSWPELIELRQHPDFRWFIEQVVSELHLENRPFREAILASKIRKSGEPSTQKRAAFIWLLDQLKRINDGARPLLRQEAPFARNMFVRAAPQWTKRRLTVVNPPSSSQLNLFGNGKIEPDAHSGGTEFSAKVNVGIITIRDDEFQAVLKRFPPDFNIRGERSMPSLEPKL